MLRSRYPSSYHKGGFKGSFGCLGSSSHRPLGVKAASCRLKNLNLKGKDVIQGLVLLKRSSTLTSKGRINSQVMYEIYLLYVSRDDNSAPLWGFSENFHA